MSTDTSSFNFVSNSQNEKLNLELPFTEHVEELRQRSIHVVLFLGIFSLISFLGIKSIVQFLEIPVSNIRFFQLSPGEYFIETVKILEEAGILVKHDFKAGKARYEINDDHNHLIDIKTGEIIEFVDQEIEKLQKKVAEKYGYTLVDHKLELYGVKKKPQ